MTDARITAAGVTATLAECANCGWRDEAKGALGRAALHHDRSGHEVRIETTTVVVYGDRAAALEAAGQGTLDL